MELHELRVAALKQASDDSRLSGASGMGIQLPSQPGPDVIIARARAYMEFLDGSNSTAAPKRKRAR